MFNWYRPFPEPTGGDVPSFPTLDDESRPLHGLLVLDLSQFLAGPVAALRLADLGARVIKIERPAGGDLGRTLAFAGAVADGDSISFHAMNRNKQSVTADLKDPADRARVLRLVERADVLIENFRPGVTKRLGLDYETVAAANPRLIYASATGYGPTGPWSSRPGQDLLAQAVSGLPWLSGSHGDLPVPVGIALADHLASIHLAHGVTAMLLRRERTGRGGRVETSLLEGMLDLQFELLSAKHFDPSITVQRGGPNSAHAFLSAPYGVYATQNGYLALAMNSVPQLGELLEIEELRGLDDPTTWWTERDRIEGLLASRLRIASTEHWLAILDQADVWCAPVLTLEELLSHDGFTAIDMMQRVVRPDDAGGLTLQTTRSPLRIDGAVLRSQRPAPRLGEHTETVLAEFDSSATAEVPS